MSISQLLQDRNGIERPRKNLFLRDWAELLARLEEPGADRQAIQEQIRNLKANRANHSYEIELAAFRLAEREHTRRTKEMAKQFKPAEDLPRSLAALERKWHIAQADIAFYQPYVDLTYEAELAYRSALVTDERIPSILEEYRAETAAIREQKRLWDEVSGEEAIAYFRDHSVFAVDRKKEWKAQLAELNAKKREGHISKKAADSEKKRFTRAYKDEVYAHRMQGPIASRRDTMESLLHERDRKRRDQIVVWKSELSDLRRAIPEEIEPISPVTAIATAPIPGLGQLLNKQPQKALLFFLGALFIYGIAIPYALGFGNYQGEGIAGLISLAEGGARVQRSLFFLIEGIIAIVLLVFAVAILILSYYDVRAVQKAAMKGARRRNWFETVRRIRTEGFPYLVNIPALIAISFIVLVPVFTMILLSFTNMDPQHQAKFQWVGLQNYKIIALGQGIAGSAFWRILFWTLLWTALATSLAILIGFSLALIANNERIRGKTFFRSVYILPWAVPAFITIMFFSIMFSPQGILTELLSKLMGQTVNVKSDTVLTRTVLILLQGWLGSSYVFLLSTGVLQGIPNDLYEAAEIDGATPWQQTLRITLPLVLFQTAPLLVGQYTFNFNNFSIIYLFNQGGPFNPMVYGNLAGSSDLLISYIYKLTIENQQQAIGAAITLVVSLGLMFFAFLGFRNSKAFKEERL